MGTPRSRILLALMFLFLSLSIVKAGREDKKQPNPKELLREAVRVLLKQQEEEGQWSYDVRNLGFSILGFTVGSTSLVAEALLFAAPDDKDVQAAIQRSLAYVLENLKHSDLEASTQDAYDVRVWGQVYALEFLCQVRACKAVGKHADEIDKAISGLVATLIEQEVPGGGWSYARPQSQQQPIVTAPAAQSLLLARSQGEKVPDELMARCRKILEGSRMKDGAVVYSGEGDGDDSKDDGFDSVPGSIGRSAACETTLVLLGGGSVKAVRATVANFFEHWEELENRRKGSAPPHQGTYNIAPYYFFYGHRYAAQAIQMLPEKERAKGRERLLERIVQTRDEDGTWTDRDSVDPEARHYGTAMVVLALLGDKAPLPPKFAKK